jgi:hypothetical protein
MTDFNPPAQTNPNEQREHSCKRGATKSFRPVSPSVASRKIKLKQPISCRGALATLGEQSRCIVYESALEEKTTLVALAHPAVTSLVDQPLAVTYADEDGKIRRHTFDYLAHLKDGRRIAIAVKPRQLAEQRNLKDELRRIASQTPRSFADAVVLVSENKVPRDLVHNARLFHAVGRDPLGPVDADAAKFVATMKGRITVGVIVQSLGNGASSFRAVVRLLAKGVLTASPRARIDHGTLVWRRLAGEAL